MTDTLQPGLEMTEEFIAEGRLLTNVAGALTIPVLSTPAMIAMMERAALRLVLPLLAPGQATVGFEVCIKHVRGAPDGTRCTSRATLTDVLDGRKLRFDVEVKDAEGNTLGVGHHERRVITPPG
jgi:predicted thioesterase